MRRAHSGHQFFAVSVCVGPSYGDEMSTHSGSEQASQQSNTERTGQKKRHFVAIANTPEPPYYSVTTTATLVDDTSEYLATAIAIVDDADQIDGFFGVEATIQGNLGIAISYWSSLEAINEWRQSPSHVAAKQRGKGEWFTSYLTRVAKVEHAY